MVSLAERSVVFFSAQADKVFDRWQYAERMGLRTATEMLEIQHQQLGDRINMELDILEKEKA